MIRKTGVRVRVGRKGAVAVETAIVLPLLLVLTIGGMELSLVLYNQQILANASREAARAGAMFPAGAYPTLAELLQDMNNRWGGLLVSLGSGGGTGIELGVGSTPCMPAGDAINVVATFTYDFVTPFAAFAMEPITLRAASSMACE